MSSDTLEYWYGITPKDLKAMSDKGQWLTNPQANLIRELQERIKRLEEFVEQLTNPKFTRDDLPKEALLQRIKRLEEAGDALLELCDADESQFHLADQINARCEAWRKAKEAKP